MEGEGNGSAGGPAPLAQRKVYRGRRTTEMNQIDESMLILPREEDDDEEEAHMEMDAAQARQVEAQEAQARAQMQAQNLAKLSRRPEEVLRDLEQEAEVLKNLHHKISQQLHMLQVEEIVLKKQAELSNFTTY